jgi:UDP-glucose 4,6-dehydratase
MTKPEFKAIAASNPEKIRGFDETMTPNFSFRDQPCSFYSGSKALAEEAVTGDGQNFIWRLRIPFDEFDSERNYITKLQRYGKVYSNFNSLTHRMDFVKACLDCWQQKVPFGIYNITNPGHITGKEVIQLIKEYITPKKKYVFFSDDHEFYSFGAKAQRSNCILDSKKIQQSGVYMRNVTEALIDAVSNWKKI